MHWSEEERGGEVWCLVLNRSQVLAHFCLSSREMIFKENRKNTGEMVEREYRSIILGFRVELQLDH